MTSRGADSTTTQGTVSLLCLLPFLYIIIIVVIVVIVVVIAITIFLHGLLAAISLIIILCNETQNKTNVSIERIAIREWASHTKNTFHLI